MVLLQKIGLQRMNEKQNDWYERRILKDIEEIESRIKALEAEKIGLQRVLTRLRKETVSSREVGRRNSINRVLVEAQILERLKANKKATPSQDLFDAAKAVIFYLKESTFRSYLSRMKKKGLIKNQGSQRGIWVLDKSD